MPRAAASLPPVLAAHMGDALCAESRALQPLLSLNDEARLAMYAPDFALPEKFLEDAASLLGAQSWMLVRAPSEKKGAEGSLF